MSESNITELTAQVIVGFLKKNPVAVSDLPTLIDTVRSALDTLGKVLEPVQQELKPAVPIRRSVTPDYIVCLEDGKKLKMLKRHLRTTYNLSPEEYRAKWGLPRDYPMVAPTYAAKRSAFAKTIGLGKSRGSTEAPAPVVQDAAPKLARGRRKAAA
ncbi:MAG TPA: MucR family transcriptional regulator [Azospirillum sp.]|nr:MucR family transcriptional regulator [Azospirillum sp.]